MIELDIEKKLQAAHGEMTLEVRFDILKGQFVTLYGPSGAGKTSTLRILSGLMKPDKGKISVKNVPWFDREKKINLKPQQRKIGFLFQDYALFPNMTVRQNLEFALAKGQDHKIISDLIDMVELGDLHNRKPGTLSGGQQQRVALARALVQRPEILLLDEPLAALDLRIRVKLQDDLLRLHREFNLTTLLISHDLGEIFKLSDKVFVVEKGRITRQGSPTEVFIGEPAGEGVRFTGEVLGIEQNGTEYLVSVLYQSGIIKIKTPESKANTLETGDKVMVASEVCNPVLYKLV